MIKTISRKLFAISLVIIMLIPILISSNHVQAATDTIPPAVITDLGTVQTNSTTITLSWTASGNDGDQGTAISYDIRYSTTGLITEETWNNAVQVSGEPIPAPAGTQQTMVVPNLSANTRYWFAMKIYDSTNVSEISNSPANKITNLNQVDVWTFWQAAYGLRERELVRIIQPDILHRGIYEWVGTELPEKNFDGIAADMSRFQKDGTSVMAGVSGFMFAPDYETLGPGVNKDEAIRDDITYDPTKDWAPIDPETPSGAAQLKYKMKRQIDMGVDGGEYDNIKEDKSSTVYALCQDVRDYAFNTYGKKVYMTCNWGYSGVDYYTAYYLTPLNNNRFDGAVNRIPDIKNTIRGRTVPTYYFQDHSGAWTNGPHNPADYPAFLRVGNAQILAGGAFPGQMRSWMNAYDVFENGCFTIQANHFKFMRENRELWHDITGLTPTTLTSSVANIFLSAFGQTGRTVLHIVNGNFTASTQTMAKKNNLTVRISLSAAPARIWLTTPDKPWSTRKQTLSYTYSGGVATITVPELQYHDVIVIEQGSSYDPVYSAMKIKFPFPNPKNIPSGNKFKFIAVQTEGMSASFNWFVNDVAGGNSTYGTIDAKGMYTAPAIVPPGGQVTIKAVSKDAASVSNQVTVNIVNAPGLPWTEIFASDSAGKLPVNWQVADGSGDWKVDSDGGTKVLHNYNMIEGRVEQFQKGVGGVNSGAMHSPTITGGDQKWADYSYQVSVKPIKTPYVWYGINSEKCDTYLGLVFRFKDSGNYYEYRWCKDNNIRLYKFVNGVETKIGGDVAATFPAVGIYTDVMVKANGTNFEAYQNGIILRTDTDSAITSGSVGCVANLSENYFKNLSVTQLPSSITDYMNDFSKMFSHTANLSFDTKNPQYFSNDASRLIRTTSTNENMIYQAPNGRNMASFSVETFFWTNESVIDNKFYVSKDYITFTEFTPVKSTITAVFPNWHKVTYSGTLPTDTVYLKIEYRNTSANAWNPEIGKVNINLSGPSGIPAVTVNDNTAGTGNNQFEYVGTWNYNTQAGAYNGDNHWSKIANNYYQVRFNGTQIRLYGAKATKHGIAGISIDGGQEVSLDLYAATRIDNVLLFDSGVLSSGQHTVKVRVTGNKNASSTDYIIGADRVDSGR